LRVVVAAVANAALPPQGSVESETSMTVRRFVSLPAALGAAALSAARLSAALSAATFLFTPLPAAAQLSDVQMEWGVTIPVRDGTELRGTIYRPADQTEPLPVILGFTPYIADVYHGKARYYARRGYVFAAVDVRGRGNSDGAFEPFHDADKDGHDVVEWLAAQPWSNGKVAMYGASYGG